MNTDVQMPLAWRPLKAEIEEALARYSGDPRPWVKGRLRVLAVLLESPKASDAELAKGAEVKLSTAENLFRNWEQDGMKKALEGFGRPPEMTEQHLATLRELILSGELPSPEDVQRWISRKVLHLEKTDEAVPLARARALYHAATGNHRRRPKYAVSAEFIAELKLRRPNTATALLRIVKKRLSVRGAANRYGVDDSTLRYYLRQASNKKKATYLPRTFLPVFFDWCNRQKKVTVEGVRGYLREKGIKSKSERSIHRYIQDWKDFKRIPRRHWTCGGSKPRKGGASLGIK
jgi:hypothetical protein